MEIRRKSPTASNVIIDGRIVAVVYHSTNKLCLHQTLSESDIAEIKRETGLDPITPPPKLELPDADNEA